MMSHSYFKVLIGLHFVKINTLKIKGLPASVLIVLCLTIKWSVYSLSLSPSLLLIARFPVLELHSKCRSVYSYNLGVRI